MIILMQKTTCQNLTLFHDRNTQHTRNNTDYSQYDQGHI